ncbi:MAG: oligoendopeptidase F [Kiritimatiellaeota bacterium]|nr:oligoendopeptidase F [Kiritimatiellota bacterium]
MFFSDDDFPSPSALPPRSEIDDSLKWNLAALYASIDDWERDFAILDSLLNAANRFNGHLGDSPERLKGAYEAFDALHRTLEKVYTHARLASDEDISDSEPMGRLDRITARFAELQGALAWFEPELLALPDERIEEYLNSAELAFYKRSIGETLRFKPHTLSAGEERLLGMASDALSTPEKVFSALNNVDIVFPEVPDGKGGSVVLTHGNFSKLLESENREVREKAFNAMYDTFGKYRDTLTATLAGCVKTHLLNRAARKYPSALDASLHVDDVPRSVYENLISTVRKRLPDFHSYLELRKKVLKIDDLGMHDLRNPLISDRDKTFTWGEARAMVLAALAPLGGEYAKLAERAFDERWIDVMESKGKRSGAYSGGCYDSYPYILMNFNGTLNDVFTLAHELGHSMHSLLSKTNQEYHYADYRIFVAEVASTTNELLLHDYLKRSSSDDDELSAHLLTHLLDEIRGTVYRQTMFAEFEKHIHEELEAGRPLTADSLSESYCELNKAYHGKVIDADARIAVEWARIPHFYYNFYVYKYATGFSAAAALSKGVLSGNSAKLEAYLGFLKAGSTKNVLDIMLDAGVDLRSSKPVDDALDLFAETTAELADSLFSTKII